MARMIANRMHVGTRLVRDHADPGAGKRRPYDEPMESRIARMGTDGGEVSGDRTSRVARVRGLRDGIDTSKLPSGWSSCGRERERVDALPLAHARGYCGDEESGGKVTSRWFDQRPRGSAGADRPHPLAFPLGKGQESSCFSQVSPFPGEPVTGTLASTVEFSGHAAVKLKFFRSFLRIQCPYLPAYFFADE